MIRREDIIEIGVYNKPHGINGEISATFDYDIDVINDINCFITDINGIYIPFFAENIRAKSNSTVLLKIEGLDDEQSVKKLVNNKIFTLKSAFQPSQVNTEETEELPLDYFIGFTISEEKEGIIGEIIDVDCSTENFLFIVNNHDKQVFIPATDDFIVDIDLECKTITMCLPMGILEI